MTTYIEYSTSAGHGTLVEHGAIASSSDGAFPANSVDQARTFGGLILESVLHITPERYNEFIAIHGGERAV